MFLCSFYLLLVNHLGNWANPGLSDHKVLSRQKKEKEREGGAGALITAGIEEKKSRSISSENALYLWRREWMVSRRGRAMGMIMRT